MGCLSRCRRVLRSTVLLSLEVRGTQGGHASRTWEVRALYYDGFFSADRPSRRVIQPRTILRDFRFVRYSIELDDSYLEHLRPHLTAEEEAVDRAPSTLRPQIPRAGEAFVHWPLGRGSTFLCACTAPAPRPSNVKLDRSMAAPRVTL